MTNQIQYRICEEGASSKKITKGCFVHLRIEGSTSKGSSLFSERYWLKIEDEPRQNSLFNALTKLKLNDSAEIVLPHKLIAESLVNLPRTQGVSAKEKVVLNVRVLRIVDADIAFDKDYDKFCKLQEQQGQRFVQQYLDGKGAFAKQQEGIYAKTLRNGNGKKAEKYGDVMQLYYVGRFLNGTKFDNTAKNGTFRYVRGLQFQMIQGIALMLATMSEGEKTLMIIPAKLAFGYKGLADIVPPFTPVVYEIEVVRVEK
ncbi:hypothetical protein FACS189456_3920 [Bacteroidia bacterium]|nr:hypothetical protein FACS189456_3920 [Bacteroidia bacterium]